MTSWLCVACLGMFAPPDALDPPPVQRPQPDRPATASEPAPSPNPEPSTPSVQRPSSVPSPTSASQPEPEPKPEPAPAPEPAAPASAPADTRAAPLEPPELPPPDPHITATRIPPDPGPSHGFSYEPSAGYSTGFMGPAINPSAHFGLFLGGSLPRRAGPRGGRQVALGALVHAEFPVLLHRHQLAVMGLAGQRNRLYWRLSGGVTGHYDAVGGGGGGALGFALPIPATRTMAMTLALTLFVDWASAANVAPGVHLSVVQF